MIETWTFGFLLALVSALFWAALDVSRKHITSKMTASTALVGLMLAQVPFVMPFMGAAEMGVSPRDPGPVSQILFSEFPEITGLYLAYGAGSIVLNVAANLLFLRAVQISPLSLTTPYLAFTPVFSAIFAFGLLGQRVTGWGVAGILVVCLGAFFLNPGTRDEGIFAPLKALWRERGSLYMLVVALTWSLTPIIDKQAADLTSPMWHTLFLATGIGLVFVAWFLVRREGKKLWGELGIMPLWLLGCGLAFVGAMVLQLGSYAFIEIAYTETLKRAVGVIAAMAAGYFWFQEKDIARRFVGAAVMVAGVAMVLLAGH